MEAGSLLNDAARNRLKRLFYQLDTDKDGYEKQYFSGNNHFNIII